MSAAADDAGVEEHAQVLGDVLLAGSRCGDELADAGLAVQKLLDEPDAEWIAEGAEALRDQLDEWLGERVRRHALNLFTTSRL